MEYTDRDVSTEALDDSLTKVDSRGATSNKNLKEKTPEYKTFDIKMCEIRLSEIYFQITFSL